MQHVIDYVVFAVAAVVGQELYTTAGKERKQIVDAIIHKLKDLQKCRNVEVNGQNIRLTSSQTHKIAHAYSVANQDGGAEVGNWVDPVAERKKVKNALNRQRYVI